MKLNLDILLDETKDIIKNKKNYKDKNKDILVLLVDYKKELIKLMGKTWYKKCVKYAEDFAKLNDDEHKKLFTTLIALFNEVFENDW